MKRPYNTALYYRLSRDDENFGDSVSIETQKTILQQFARDNQFHVVDEYIDDGWSGTNFDRSAFQQMMDDVDAGRINCIITKDLSRFGREHVMMDYYLEFVFPEKNIRYIAVTENEDTEKGLSDFVPFKNLLSQYENLYKRIRLCVLLYHPLIFIKKNKKLQTAKTIYSSNITFNIIISNFGSKHLVAGRTYCIVLQSQTTPF